MALTDVQHVEAVALINGLLDHGPSIPPDVRVGAEGWLAEHNPPPGAYSAAMRSLAGQEAPTVDPGFIHGVRQHVEEDGRLARVVAEVGDPALWGPQLAGQWTPDRLREARERSLAQGRTLLRRAVGS